MTTHDELQHCALGGDHFATYNEHLDAWCVNCGDRLLLPASAGYTYKYDDEPIACGMKGLIFALIIPAAVVWALAIYGAIRLIEDLVR